MNIDTIWADAQRGCVRDVVSREGRINILVNNFGTTRVDPDLSREAYGMAKSAVIRLTKDIALQNARSGIRANAVCPGCTATEAVSQNMTPEFTKALAWGRRCIRCISP